MSFLKAIGTVILGLVVLTAVMFIIAVLIYGTAAVAEKLLPFMWVAASIAMVFCIVVLLPLSLFRRTRIVPACGFLIASHLFGLGMWMYGFLVTYDLWGGTGIFFGLLLGGIGVVPLAVIAAALNQMWTLVGELVFGLVVTFGPRMFAFYLAKTLDRAAEEVPVRRTYRHRIATPDDVRGIFSVLAEVALEIPVRLDTCGRQKAIFSKVKECASSGESLVAIDGDERVIGFLLVEPDKRERFCFNNMALHLPYGGVTTSWRKRGVFPALIQQVMSRMVPLTATVKAANRSEIATRLLRLGFQNAGPGSFPDETNFRWQPDQVKLR